MRKQLLVQMPSTADAQAVSWLVRDDEQPAGRFFQGALADVATQAAGARVVALVPGADVLLTEVELPNLNRQRLAKAVPFALEEQLASDVEDLHIAIGRRAANGQVANAVVSRQVIDSWLERLREAGLQADVVTSEVFGVPFAEAGAEELRWAMVINGDRACLRTAAQAGLALETANLAAVLRTLLDEAAAQAPAEITVAVCGEEDFDASAPGRELRALCEERGIALQLRQAEEACPQLLARGFDEQDAINLLQGDYSRKQQLEKLLRPWLPALVLLSLWLVVQVGLMGFDYARLSKQEQDTRSQIEAVFHAAFPQGRLVPGNEKELMERGLKKLRGSEGTGGGFLALLAQAGGVWKDIPNLKLRTLRFKGDQLDVDLEIPDLQQLDKLKRRLMDEAKLKVDIVSASSRDGKVESRITLSGGGA
jgi:general secretion pathway protein L